MAGARTPRTARPAPRSGGQVATCGWPACPACPAVVRFVERWQAGEIVTPAPVTSAWWESPAAADLYRRNVNLPPCQHPEPAP